MSTTTHLVCAPDNLGEPAVVVEWLVVPGCAVEIDQPLVRLAVAGEGQLVLTPLAGVLTERCVDVGEPLTSSDLLAMLEAEVPHFGGLIDEADSEAALAVPACRLPSASATPANAFGEGDATQEALLLCAVLGLAPDEVPRRRGELLDRTTVERHVRGELRTLNTLREMLATRRQQP